jgi:hypothetical protein
VTLKEKFAVAQRTIADQAIEITQLTIRNRCLETHVLALHDKLEEQKRGGASPMARKRKPR